MVSREMGEGTLQLTSIPFSQHACFITVVVVVIAIIIIIIIILCLLCLFYYFIIVLCLRYNLGQYKMEQLSPIPPKAMMKARRSKKRAILASLKLGEGWSRCSIYFVQDCSLI